MPTAIAFSTIGRKKFPLICQREKEGENTRFLSRQDFVNIIPPAILEKVFPPDNTLAGIEVESFPNFVLLTPRGLSGVMINDRHLRDDHSFCVNLDAAVEDVLNLGGEKITMKTFLVN
jgi:hypothetical protein